MQQAEARDSLGETFNSYQSLILLSRLAYESPNLRSTCAISQVPLKTGNASRKVCASKIPEPDREADRSILTAGGKVRGKGS
jgi:hypothetical protein